MDMNIYELIRGRRHYLPEGRLKDYMYQLLKSMDHMHRNGIFHRDIKVARGGGGKRGGGLLSSPITFYLLTAYYLLPTTYYYLHYYAAGEHSRAGR